MRMCVSFRLIVALVVALPALVCAHDSATCIVDPFQSKSVLPTTLFSELQCKPVIDLVAAQGEYEASSFAIRSEISVQGVTFVSTDLVGSNGRISRDRVRIQYVKPWYQAAGSVNPVKRSGTARVLVPELLLNDNDLVHVDVSGSRNLLRMSDGRYVDISVEREEETEFVEHPLDEFSVRDAVELIPTNLSAGETQQIWLTVSVPVDVPPGEYRGSVQVATNGLPISRDVPIYLRVPRFKLAAPSLDYSIYYRGQLDLSGRGSVSSERKTEGQFVAELEDMLAHGVTNPTIYQDKGGIAAFRRVLELRAQHGISNAHLFQMGVNTGSLLPSGGLSSGKDQFQQLQRVAVQQGAKDLYVYCIDEASPTQIEVQHDVWRWVKREGGRLFAAAYTYGAAERKYAGNIDVLVLGIPVDPSAISFFRSAGTRVYMYNQPQVGVESPEIYRSNYGVRAWRAGFDGVMNYAYQHSMGSIWNDFDNPRFKDHVFAYPTTNGVIDTIAWEGFREGVDDVRYISTLVKMSGYDQTGRARAVVRKIKAEVLAPGAVRKVVEETLSALCISDSGAVRDSGVCVQ